MKIPEMKNTLLLRFLAFTTLALATIAIVSSAPALAQNSAPQPVPITTTIPVAQDVDYPGTIQLDIDATNTQQGIFRIKETIPVVKSGPMVLLYPKWLPGHHGPRGEIEKLAGLQIRASGQRLAWTRDPVEVYAFHIEVPAGAKNIELEFEFVSATVADQGRMVMTPNMLSLQFTSLSLYPAGYFVRRIAVQARVLFPQGWAAASGLPATARGATYTYDKTSYEILIDSPVLAGRYYRAFELSPRVTLDAFADSIEELSAKPEHIDAHKKMVEQLIKTMGSEHYDHYHFLLSITDELGGIGLEHHRSTEIGVRAGYFTKWDDNAASRNVLPHEYTHSWNGKYRRGDDLWTPDYQTPMRDSLLWVYEGQTQFWGYVFQTRAGLVNKADTLDAYAATMASLDNRPARTWRPLVDTTNDPIITARAPKGWVSWQRSEDYYNEGLLVWMEVDSILREQSKGTRSLDDFAGKFFGGHDGDYGEVTYNFDDVVNTLNGLVAFDWHKLLNELVNGVSMRAPLAGFERNGYKLVYTDVPNLSGRDKDAVLLAYTIGLTLDKSGITSVAWDSPTFKAGIDLGDTLVAVNNRSYSADRLKEAVKASKESKEPIRLLMKSGDRYREVNIDYHGGLRYPHLQKLGDGEAGLDQLLQPR